MSYGMLSCPGVVSWLFILRLIFNGYICFYDTFNENKPSLIYKHNKNDRIKVSLSVFMCLGVSWGIWGCPGVIRLTQLSLLTLAANARTLGNSSGSSLFAKVSVRWFLVYERILTK